jgi:hypothetical protein
MSGLQCGHASGALLRSCNELPGCTLATLLAADHPGSGFAGETCRRVIAQVTIQVACGSAHMLCALMVRSARRLHTAKWLAPWPFMWRASLQLLMGGLTLAPGRLLMYRHRLRASCHWVSGCL